MRKIDYFDWDIALIMLVIVSLFISAYIANFVMLNSINEILDSISK
jgi:hypothetical protein